MERTRQQTANTVYPRPGPEGREEPEYRLYVASVLF